MLYIPLFLFIIFFEFVRKKKSKVDSLSIFGFLYLISYVMTLMLWGMFPESFNDLPYSLNYDASNNFEVVLVFYVSYFLYIFFYQFINRIRFRYSLRFRYIKNFSQEKLNKRIILIVALFALIVVFNIFNSGGALDYIAAGNEARHNKVSFGLGGYLNYFLSASLLLMILLAYVYIHTTKLRARAVIFCMFILLFIGILSRGGRGGIIFSMLYLVIYLYSVGLFKIKIKTTIVVLILAFISLFVIYFTRVITYNIMIGHDVFDGVELFVFLDNFFKVLIYPFKYSVHKIYIVSEFYANPEIYNYPRVGLDIISGILLVIPGVSGSNFGLPELPDIISQYVMGKDNGYIPPGWVGWSLIDGGLLFLVFKLFWSALICVFVDKSHSYFVTDLFSKTVYFILILFVTDMLFQGTAMNLIRGSLGDFAVLLLLFFIPYIRVGKLKLMRINN